MNRVQLSLLAIAAMFVGTVAALLVPGPGAVSAASAAVRINPGPTHTYLTTSWHDRGALDWGHASGGANAIDSVVSWRSHSYRSDPSSASQIGSVSASTITGATCKSVLGRFTNTIGTTTNADVKYVHTYLSGTTFFYVFARSTWYYQSYGVAKIAGYPGNPNGENQACYDADLTDAPHLHQAPLSPFSGATWNYTTTGTSYSVTGLNEQHASHTFLF